MSDTNETKQGIIDAADTNSANISGKEETPKKINLRKPTSDTWGTTNDVISDPAMIPPPPDSNFFATEPTPKFDSSEYAQTPIREYTPVHIREEEISESNPVREITPEHIQSEMRSTIFPDEPYPVVDPDESNRPAIQKYAKDLPVESKTFKTYLTTLFLAFVFLLIFGLLGVVSVPTDKNITEGTVLGYSTVSSYDNQGNPIQYEVLVYEYTVRGNIYTATADLTSASGYKVGDTISVVYSLEDYRDSYIKEV